MLYFKRNGDLGWSARNVFPGKWARVSTGESVLTGMKRKNARHSCASFQTHPLTLKVKGLSLHLQALQNSKQYQRQKKKGVLLERPRRTASPPARVPTRPPGQVGPMESILYEHRLSSTPQTTLATCSPKLNATTDHCVVVCKRIAARTQHGPQRLWLQRAGRQQGAALSHISIES